VGHNWAMLPSAAGFVDPLLSTGFPLTLLGVSRIAAIIANHWRKPGFHPQLQNYAWQTDRELLAVAHLMGSLYASMNDFEVFVALSLLYFTAASYSEAALRLGKLQLASSFLLSDNARFWAPVSVLCDRARGVTNSVESDALVQDILRTIEPFNIAGLGNPTLYNWYPLDASELIKSACKLESNREEIQLMLRRCGHSVALSNSPESV